MSGHTGFWTNDDDVIECVHTCDPEHQRLYDCRRLVVLDPEDATHVGQLASAFEAAAERAGHFISDNRSARVRAVRAALRSLLAPPEPDEPEGLGAVVEASVAFDDGKGFGPAYWSKAEDGTWVCITDGLVGQAYMWPFLKGVKVLSPGWSE